MRLIISLSMIFALVSCAHKHGEQTHHHHNSKNDISSGDHGDGKYIVKDRGETYYFDSEDAFVKYSEQIQARKNKPKCSRRGRQIICKD